MVFEELCDILTIALKYFDEMWEKPATTSVP